MDIRLTVQFDEPVTAYGLVVGGWFPLALIGGSVVAVDRNVLSLLHVVSHGGRRHDSRANRYWLRMLNSPEVTINPVLCAMEGNQRSIPSFSEFCSSFESACAMVREHLPRAGLVRFELRHYEAAYDLVARGATRYQAELQFLQAAAPLLANRVSRVRSAQVETQLLGLAREYGVRSQSFVFMVALSCLYERPDGVEPAIGRNILKPAGFDEQQAHNTLSDLRALELLAGASSLGLGRVCFCTRDKHLAAFWCALKVRDVSWVGESQLQLNGEWAELLFPRLSGEAVRQMAERVSAAF